MNQAGSRKSREAVGRGYPVSDHSRDLINRPRPLRITREQRIKHGAVDIGILFLLVLHRDLLQRSPAHADGAGDISTGTESNRSTTGRGSCRSSRCASANRERHHALATHSQTRRPAVAAIASKPVSAS